MGLALLKTMKVQITENAKRIQENGEKMALLGECRAELTMARE